MKKALKIYRTYYTSRKEVIQNLLDYYMENGFHIAIWGAGLKGLAFLKIIDPNMKYIKCIFDESISKLNQVVSTGHKILDYRIKENQDIQIILIMNTNFENEIMASIKKQNMDSMVVSVDNIIEGELTLDEAIEFYQKKGTKNGIR